MAVGHKPILGRECKPGSRTGALAVIHEYENLVKDESELKTSALWCTVWTGPVQTMLKEADVHPHNKVV